jgi:membrane protease YdiL (CAAX protease family)
VRTLEGRRPAELAPTPGAALFLAGLLLGGALFAVVIGLLAVAGVARIGAWQGTARLAPALSVALGSAVGEEIVFRGVLFRLVEERAGTTVGIVVSAVLFGVVHCLQPGANLISILAIALEAGVLLALAFAATRSLWAPIGLHLGWNFTEGGVFGQAVSGGQAHGLIASTLHGGPFVTGGAFGPEASLTAMAVSLLASAALAGTTLRRGEWRAGRLRRG